MAGATTVIVLDTHVWLWWLHNPKELSKQAESAIKQSELKNGILISAISVWEVAVKIQLGKLIIPMDIDRWFVKAKDYPGCRIKPLTPEDAISSTLLPGKFHKDPADRIIIAFARRHGVPLITCDQKIIEYAHVETLW